MKNLAKIILSKPFAIAVGFLGTVFSGYILYIEHDPLFLIPLTASAWFFLAILKIEDERETKGLRAV